MVSWFFPTPIFSLALPNTLPVKKWIPPLELQISCSRCLTTCFSLSRLGYSTVALVEGFAHLVPMRLQLAWIKIRFKLKQNINFPHFELLLEQRSMDNEFPRCQTCNALKQHNRNSCLFSNNLNIFMFIICLSSSPSLSPVLFHSLPIKNARNLQGKGVIDMPISYIYFPEDLCKITSQLIFSIAA